MAINFTDIETFVSAVSSELTIRLRENLTNPPDPAPAPDPIPPDDFVYPPIVANATYSPANVGSIMALLEGATFPGAPPAGAKIIVVLRGGVYNFSRTVQVHVRGPADGLEFVAAHGEQVVFNFNTSTGHGFYFRGTVFPQDVFFRRIRFTDLRTVATAQGGFQLIKFDTGRNIRFYECEFDNSHASGVYGNSGARDILFYGCIFRDNGWNTQFDHGAYMHSSEGVLAFNKCCFSNNGSHGIHAFDGGTVSIEYIRNIAIDACTWLSYGRPQDRPIIFQDDAPPGMTVNNNIVSNCMFFNAFPEPGDATETDRNSIKFVRPELCLFRDNVTWNVPLVAGTGVAQMNNIVVPPVKDAALIKMHFLDVEAGRYLLTLFNYAQADSLVVQLPDLPSGRYEAHHISAPLGTTPIVFEHLQGDSVVFSMTIPYARPQLRAGGFNYPTTKAAHAFRLIRVPPLP